MKFVSKFVVGAALASLALTSPASACLRTSGWVAPLTLPKGVHAQSAGSGNARILFDVQKPYGIMLVSTKNVKDVTRIEMRFERSQSDLNGPLMAVLYDKSQGVYKGKLSKRLDMTDVKSVPEQGVKTAGDVVNRICQGVIAVVICTKSHPRGQLAGTFSLRPVIVYSDKPGGYHDPSTHHEAFQAKGPSVL